MTSPPSFKVGRPGCCAEALRIVLIDCPPSLGLLTLNALAAASHLVLVTEPSFLSLQGISELLETRDWCARI